ncbi:winged helix-turn-helix domain-containing protein [Pseudoalteromonas phenolica]|uniref:winged helix-turn-helix domain-containing protein n=1 Tax=Pseudoalteromonas phenolica TaxID=161398 RepID=UPI00110AA08D|nr:winged helix-turn-helix domain-containing protein [Pseudoalteromonas phenolica]TMO56461.1 CadC family transcriptional regulator [Pseudoalteromonas phenolica]
MRFQIDDKVLDTVTGIVSSVDSEHSIRAKTLQVLNYLIEHKSDIVSKQAVINAVWDDVVVQDQVLTQSIKEIRDLLGAKVIKTYSRKGYQWVAPLLPEIIQTESLQLNNLQNKIKARPVIDKSKVWIGASITVFLLLVMVFVFLFIRSEPPLKVAFLPVKNDVQDSIHNWVPLRGQEQLTLGLSQSSQLAVIESEHVLFAIERLNTQQRRAYQSGALYPLQEKLEVDLIVATRLTGFPEDFQLHYQLQTPFGVEQGIEFASSVDDAFNQLVSKIAMRFDEYQPSGNDKSTSQFSNEAFARGVAKYLEQDFSAAKPLLQTALSTEPDLLAAKRYLAASFANSGQINEAIALLKDSINLAQTQGQQGRELLRAYLMIGYLQINWPQQTDRENELTSAEQYIEQAKQLAEQQNDELFIAYSHEELGKIKRLQGEFDASARHLSAALQYHKQFQGDYGQTAALIELAKVSNAQKNQALSEQYLQQAFEIATHSQAPANQIWVLLARADIARSQLLQTEAEQFAKKAQVIANHSDNPMLIARVDAWFNNATVYTVN